MNKYKYHYNERGKKQANPTKALHANRNTQRNTRKGNRLFRYLNIKFCKLSRVLGVDVCTIRIFVFAYSNVFTSIQLRNQKQYRFPSILQCNETYYM